MLPNLRMLCMDEGFDNIDIHYVGGLIGFIGILDVECMSKLPFE